MANEVSIIVTAKDLATGVIKQLGRTMEAENRKWQALSKSVEGFNHAMRGIATSATVATAGVLAFGVKSAAAMEQTKTALTTMLGSLEKANQMYSQMYDFAAKTPFEFDQIAHATTKLLGFGFAAEKIIPTLTAVGDAVAATGGNRDAIEGVILALGQMKLKATVSEQEIRQLVERGIPAYEILQNKFKLTAEQMENIGKAGIDSKQAVDALVEGIEERFAGMMDKQSKSMGGLFSTAKDQAKAFLLAITGIDNQGNIIGGSIFEYAKKKLEEFSSSMTRWQQDGTLKRWAEDIRSSVQSAVGSIEKLFEKLSAIGKWVSQNGETVKKWVVGFIAAWAFTETLASFAKLIESVRTLTTALNIWAASEGVAAVATFSATLYAIAAAAGVLAALKFDKWGREREANANKINTNAITPGGPEAVLLGTQGKAWSSVLGNVGTKQPSLAEAKALLSAAGISTNTTNKPFKYTNPADIAKETVATVLAEMEKALKDATQKRKIKGSSFDLNAEKYGILSGAQDKLLSMGAYSTAQGLERRIQAVAPVSTKKFEPDSGDMVAFMEAQKKAEEYHKSVIEGYQKMGNDWRKAQVEKKKAEEEYHQSVIDGYKRMGDQWRKEQAEKRKADAEKAKLLAEELAAARKQAAQTLTGMVTNRLSVVGGVIQGAQAGQKLGAAFGPEGAVIGAAGGALVGLITQSKTFEKLLAIINPILESVANAFGQVLEPLLPIAQTVSTIVSPIIKTFGNILKTAIEPAMPILFNIIKYLGLGLLGLGIGVINVKNSIIGAAQGILRGIGNFLAWLGLGLQDEGYRMIAAADKMEGLKASTDELQTAFDKLKDMTYDKAKADSAAAAATESLMRNVPELFKVALVRNSVAKGIPGFATGGYVPATPGGTIVRVGEGGEGEYIVPKSKMGGVVIHVDARGSISPDEVERRAERGVMAAIQRMQMAKYGTAVGVV